MQTAIQDVASIWYVMYWAPCVCRRKQKENQEDLLKRVNEETLRVLRHNQDENNQGGSGAGRQVSEVVAYRSISDMPSVRDLAIQVCLCAMLCMLLS